MMRKIGSITVYLFLFDNYIILREILVKTKCSTRIS